jgi:mono/diheme cytochrome c family protein
MKRIAFEYMVLAAAVASTIAVALPARAQSTAERKAETVAESVARGKYIVTTSGCHDCHTPWVMGPKGPEPDMTRALSGHPEDVVLPPPPKVEAPWVMTAAATNTAWAGPWGISYTANLTPDPETGLGKWTLRNFAETIRTGRHMGRGREVLPPMPVQVYRNWTDADFEAVFSYLRSIPAIRNRVPEPMPPAEAVAAR